MRDHYVGDISDLLKFSLLRRLRGADRKLGIVWYYVEGSDNPHDGRHLEWVEEEQWNGFDPELYVWLKNLSSRSVAALEDNTFWQSNAIFHREPVPAKHLRRTWAIENRRRVEGCDLVFLDPDNGLGEGSQKHASVDEVKALRRAGRVLCFITFLKRQKHSEQIAQLHHDLAAQTGAANIVTLRTSVAVPSSKNQRRFVPRIRWFTLLDVDESTLERINGFAKSLNALHRVRAHVESDNPS